MEAAFKKYKPFFRDFISNIGYSARLHKSNFFRIKLMFNPLIIYYHRVCDKQDDPLHYPDLIVSNENFERQMKFLKDHYIPTSVDKLAESLRIGARIHNRAVGVTFDDGYLDNYTNAFPILKKYDIPATIFITTAHIGTSNPFWWDRVGVIIEEAKKGRISPASLKGCNIPENLRIMLNQTVNKQDCLSLIVDCLKQYGKKDRLEIIAELEKGMERECGKVSLPRLFMSKHELLEMKRNGTSFGSHTHTHLVLTEGSEDQVRRELKVSKIVLEEIFDEPIRGFSYPDGMLNEKIMKYVHEEGYEFGVQTGRFAGKYAAIYALARKKIKESNCVNRNGKFSAPLFAMELALANDFLFGRNLRRNNPYRD